MAPVIYYHYKMDIDIKTIRVTSMANISKDNFEVFYLAKHAIVLIWEKGGGTWCKDVLGNEWYVLSNLY